MGRAWSPTALWLLDFCSLICYLNWSKRCTIIFGVNCPVIFLIIYQQDTFSVTKSSSYNLFRKLDPFPLFGVGCLLLVHCIVCSFVSGVWSRIQVHCKSSHSLLGWSIHLILLNWECWLKYSANIKVKVNLALHFFGPESANTTPTLLTIVSSPR